ncbi:hypothetical protein DC498_11150 [Terrimonas sp.]|uniref:hypothetical protein n=1 Tax=Terrimonas sp. TaxID=1914338 RepID=UPI000D512D58|nr:hypothetical protein [Terrimonas sp.]PVD52272.1 hypothetical protein DC498_11150 [Terrimonas sp.]
MTTILATKQALIVSTACFVIIHYTLRQAYPGSRQDENQTITATAFNELKALTGRPEPYFSQSKPLQLPQNIRIYPARYNL